MTNPPINVPPPRRRRRRWPMVLVVLVLLGAGWAAWQRPWEPKPITVTVEQLAAGPASRVLAVNGRIEPEAQINVSPTVSGQLVEVAASEGDRIAAGSLLASIDEAAQQSAVTQAVAALDAAQVQLQKVRQDYDRAQNLGDSISRKDLDAAKLAVQTAQNDVDRLSAARDQALTLLRQYSVTAPFDGTVLTRGVDPGQVVGPSTILFSFADLTRLRASASIDEIYSAEIRRGLKVRLQPSGYNRTLEGSVSFVSPTVDSATGGRQVRVDIGDIDGLDLPIGLTVNLNIVVDEEASVLTVPRAAILDAATEPAVLKVVDGKAVRVPIEFVDWPSDRLIVTSGVAAGDNIILAPAPGLEGKQVVVRGAGP